MKGSSTLCLQRVSRFWTPYGAVGRGASLAAARDLATGLVVGLVFWPVSLGHTTLAGLPSSVAVGTAVLPAIIYSFTGSLPLLALQSGSTVALCMGELTESAEAIGMTPLEIAGLVGLLVGCMHIVLGLLDLASLTELFSQPLLRGRTAAAALLVLASVMRTLTGTSLPEGASPIPMVQFVRSLSALPTAHWRTCGMSACLVLALLGFKRLGGHATAQALRRPGGATSETPPKSPASPTSPLPLPMTSSASAESVVPSPTTFGRGSSGFGMFSISRAALNDDEARCGGSATSRCCRQFAQALIAMANLLVMIAAAAAYHFMGDPSIRLVSPIEAPRLAPAIRIPSLAQLAKLVPSSALVAFMSLGGHLIVAERARRPQDLLDARRELFALGLGSIGAVVGGGMAVMPNLGNTTAVKHCTGGFSSIGNAIGHVVAFFVAAKVPEMQRIPACAIAAILFVEFAPLLLEAPRDVRHLLRQLRSDGALTWRALLSSDLSIYLAALVSPLAFGIIQGSVIAIMLELLFAVSRFAGAGYTILGRVPGTDIYDELGVAGSNAEEVPNVYIVRFSGPRWFGNVASTTRIARRERMSRSTDAMFVVADMSMVSFLDETALVHYRREWSNRKERIIVSNCCARVRGQLERSGLLDDVLVQPAETLTHLHRAVCYAESMVAEQHPADGAASSPWRDITGADGAGSSGVRAR